jgi:DNA repair protein RecO (recombination protein O)
MEWVDEGIVLGFRKHGESSAILEIMTEMRGRHLGLVRGGAGARLRPILEPGNTIRVTWRARLDEHLGHYAVEGLTIRGASFFASAHALYGLTHICELVRLLPERDPHPAIHQLLAETLEELQHAPLAAQRVAQFELQLLAELGFGLDLEECAASGTRDNLIYVSPKSGRAVSRDAGAPWADKLFRLPGFLHDNATATSDELRQSYALTGYFLTRHVMEPRGISLPVARDSFISTVLRMVAADQPLASAS